MNTGNRLRELRKEKGLTLRELADKLHLAFSNIAMIERGERNFTSDSLKLFCDFFNVSSDYLLGFSDIRQSTPQSPTVPNLQFALHGYESDLTDDDKEMILSLAKKLANKNDTK